MIPTHRAPTPPGEILAEEFLAPMNLTQTALAKRMDVDVQVVNGIVRGRRAVTPETAWKLAAALETTPEFWMNLQTACDLFEARPKRAAAR
jgi:addiction module HigA family antidote